MGVLNQQLKKGVLEILVLKIISDADVYGYELIKKLDELSAGYFKIKEGSLYPIMYRLEDKGFIQSYRKEMDGARRVPRKYYKVTKEGQIALGGMIDSWIEFTDISTSILKGENHE